MAKDKIAYVCSNCGQESPKWIGKCPSCGQWNTFKEIRVAADTKQQAATTAAASAGHALRKNKVLKLRDISNHDDPRYRTTWWRARYRQIHTFLADDAPNAREEDSLRQR